MIDWTTISISLFSTSVIVGAVIYGLRKSFDRIVDLKFEELKESRKSEIAEKLRRSAKLYDSQYEVLNTVLSLIYRVRNVSRDIISRSDLNENTNIEKKLDEFNTSRALHDYSGAIELILYENRAILPEPIFVILHEMKKPLRILSWEIESLSRRGQGLVISNKFKDSYKEIDKGYEFLTSEIEGILGVNSENT